MSGKARMFERILAILQKDARHLMRNPLALGVMAAGLVGYSTLYWLIPGESAEPYHVGIAHHGLGRAVAEARVRNEGRGFELVEFDAAEKLYAAVADPDEGAARLLAGVHFPDDFSDAVRAGRPTTVSVYYDGAVSREQTDFLHAEFREFAFRAAGHPIPIRSPDRSKVMVGAELAREVAPIATLLRPALATLILLFEILLIALLTSAETRSGVAAAILATPVRLGDFLLAKATFGVGVAFCQAVLLCLLIGAFAKGAGLVLCSLLLGAMLVGGCGFFAGSRGRDMMGAVGWSLVFLLPMAVPAIASLLPGSSSGWIRLIPTWPLVEVLTRVTVEEAGLRDISLLMAQLVAWAGLFFVAGLGSFKRMVASL